MKLPVYLFAFGLLALAIALGLRKNKSLRASGKIIQRDLNFAEDAEIFTLRRVTPEEVTEAVKALPYAEMHTSMKGSSAAQRFTFTGRGFEASLRMQEADADDKSVYRFEFTTWQNRNGVPQYAVDMNILTTAIERMFLGFDGSAQVAAQKRELTTKHSII